MKTGPIMRATLSIDKYRKQLVEVFSPDDVAWREAVYKRATAVTQAAIHGLRSERPATAAQNQ